MIAAAILAALWLIVLPSAVERRRDGVLVDDTRRWRALRSNLDRSIKVIRFYNSW